MDKFKPALGWRKRRKIVNKTSDDVHEEGGVCARCGGLVFDPVIPQKQQEWVNTTAWRGLTPEDWDYIEKNCGSIRSAIKTAEALLKEKNQ